MMFLKIIRLVAGVAKMGAFRSREMVKDPEPPQRGKNRNRSRPTLPEIQGPLLLSALRYRYLGQVDNFDQAEEAGPRICLQVLGVATDTTVLPAQTIQHLTIASQNKNHTVPWDLRITIK